MTDTGLEIPDFNFSLDSKQIFWLILAVIIGFSSCGVADHCADGISADPLEKTKQVCLAAGHSPACCAFYWSSACKEEK